MLILSTVSDVRVGDLVIQLVFLLILMAVIVGVVSFMVKKKSSNKRLDRIEEKIDRLLSDKDK